MWVERGLLDGKGREDSGGPGKSSSRKSKRRQRRPRPPAQTLVQRLFDTCKWVFSHGEAGGVPSPADVERIRCVLEGMVFLFMMSMVSGVGEFPVHGEASDGDPVVLRTFPGMELDD